MYFNELLKIVLWFAIERSYARNNTSLERYITGLFKHFANKIKIKNALKA